MSFARRAPLAVTCLMLSGSSTHVVASQQPASNAEIHLVVRSDSGPIPRAQVIVNRVTAETDAEGRATLHVVPGPVDITVVKEGFDPVTISATGTLGQSQVIPVTLERQTAMEEHVTVSATRTDKRIEDQPKWGGRGGGVGGECEKKEKATRGT